MPLLEASSHARTSIDYTILCQVQQTSALTHLKQCACQILQVAPVSANVFPVVATLLEWIWEIVPAVAGLLERIWEIERISTVAVLAVLGSMLPKQTSKVARNETCQQHGKVSPVTCCTGVAKQNWISQCNGIV